MEANNLKTHYSAKELLNMSLTNLPNSVQAIIYQAKKNNWKSQKRQGRGGGLEYELASLPIEIQNELLLKTTPAQTAVELQKIEETRPLASNEIWQ
ncbi:DNA-binding protein, partial [Haemophilus paraphrohaemolyticus]